MTMRGGSMTVRDVAMETSGDNPSAVATDPGGGAILVTGASAKVSGQNSAGIYSTGSTSATNTTFEAAGAEAAVIEGPIRLL